MDSLEALAVADTRHTPAAPARRPPGSWVPIRSLAPRHRERIAQHLLALPGHDRYLRFGYMASDDQIMKYVQQIDFDRDEVLGIFNRHLRLLAMAHLAYLPADSGQTALSAEFGVSVAAHARGRGYGKRLFDLAALHARNRGVQTLLIHALSENTAMLRIARNAGAEVVRDGGESQAHLRLPADTLASQVEQIVETNAAEWDYRFKQQARRLERLKAALSALAGPLQSPTDSPRDPPA
ncbi:MAG TPA: GNAT family N-acetyltransferase [Burkholderiaceae bacterium]|nr:GNAT family N-acetyltransferase [Burkholderiaceae bacterium]